MHENNPGDPVNHPSHYTAYKGLEIIDLTEQMNFNRGNAVKYIARAGLKNKDTEVEDLRKAVWYIEREVDRLTKNGVLDSTNAGWVPDGCNHPPKTVCDRCQRSSEHWLDGMGQPDAR